MLTQNPMAWEFCVLGLKELLQIVNKDSHSKNCL